MRKLLNKLPGLALALLALACLAATLSACGDSGSSSSGETSCAEESSCDNPDPVPGDSLEPCTEKLEGETAFVREEKTTYVCKDGEWVRCGDCGSSSADPDTADYDLVWETEADARKNACNEDREGDVALALYADTIEMECAFDKRMNDWRWAEKKSEAPEDGEKAKSSSSSVEKAKSSSSSVEKAKSSSSSAKPDGGDKNSSSGGKAESADSKSSSSSAKPDSSGDTPSSSSSKTGPARANTSSSSYNRTHWFSGPLWRGGEYKTFIDDRDGREYYYLTYVGKDTSGMYDTISVMSENLNIGEMVPGTGDQSDDSKIERYCYDNDTLKCMEYGGLYQWAEMMQLPSECNTKSCADQIKPNHRGICPSGWHLLTYNDFYIVVHSKDNNHGVEGVRADPFGGYNNTGYSLVGAGYNWNYEFSHITKTTYWHYPQELEGYEDDSSLSGAQTNSSTGISSNRALKTNGFSVRCVMDK